MFNHAFSKRSLYPSFSLGLLFGLNPKLFQNRDLEVRILKKMRACNVHSADSLDVISFRFFLFFQLRGYRRSDLSPEIFFCSVHITACRDTGWHSIALHADKAENSMRWSDFLFVQATMSAAVRHQRKRSTF